MRFSGVFGRLVEAIDAFNPPQKAGGSEANYPQSDGTNDREWGDVQYQEHGEHGQRTETNTPRRACVWRWDYPGLRAWVAVNV